MLQQQVRALHRETGRVQTAPQGCFSSGSISTAVAGQLGERPLKGTPRSWESENPHQGRLQGEPALVSSLQGRPGYRDKSRAHGAGDGGRASALPHRQHPSQLRVLLFCSSGDEDRLLPDGQTKGAVNAWVCSPECAGSFVRKRERTRESPYDVGLIGKNTSQQPSRRTDGRTGAGSGPYPRQGNTDRVLEWQWWQGQQGLPHSWAPGPAQAQQEAVSLAGGRRPAGGSEHRVWELTWALCTQGSPCRAASPA